MGATSVTGKGPGSAEGLNRGAARQTLGAGHLIGAHIVAAGSVALVAGSAVVALGELVEGVTNYSCHVTNNSDADAVFCSLAAAVSPNTGVVLTITGTATDTVSYMVVRNGVTL